MTALTQTRPEPAPAVPASPEVMSRLVTPMPTDRLLGWLATLVVTALAAGLRFWRLATPKGDIFDEVYYHWEALGLLRHGVEQEKVPAATADFVVHPPLGKWAISVGIKLFGNTEFGWRFSSAVAGTIAVLLIIRLARRMFRSTLLGGFAGLLFSLDGMEFVQSRVAMLDIFYLTFEVAALACLVADRDQGRSRLAARLQAGAPTSWPGPQLGVRWWRLATGFFLGCTGATKWDGVFILPAFAALAFGWDVGARRTAGISRPVRAALRRDWAWLVPGYLLVPSLIYTVSWTGWFLSTTRYAYDRHYHGRAGVVGSLLNWARYQREEFRFHTNLTNVAHCLGGPLNAAHNACAAAGTFYPAVHHPYESKPIGWLVLARPVAYYYKGPKLGQLGCASPGGCAKEVLNLGTPALWWVGTIALLLTALVWAARRDWRAALIVLLFSACFFPWTLYETRVMFSFYILPGLPFLVLALTLLAGLLLSGPRRRLGVAVVAGYALVVVVNFAYLYPVLAGQTISMSAWQARMWFPGWI